MDYKLKIYKELPAEVKARSRDAIGLLPVRKGAGTSKQQFQTFLEEHIPRGDKDQVEDEVCVCDQGLMINTVL